MTFLIAPRARRWCLLAIFVLLGTLPGCGGGGGGKNEALVVREVAPGSGLGASQVLFPTLQMGYEVSSWGCLRVDPQQLLQATGIEGGWLNLATERGWALVNVPLPPPGAPAFSVYFDLGLDELEPLQQTRLRVWHSNQGIAAIRDLGGEARLWPVDALRHHAEGAGPALELDPGRPPTALSLFADVRRPLRVTEWHQAVTNQQCAHNQCMTMAAANALQYLEDMGVVDVPHAHDPGVDGDGTLVGELDEDAGRGVRSRVDGDGLFCDDMLEGTFEYLWNTSLIHDLSNRHQGLGWRLPAADFLEHASVSTFDGAVPTFAWIRSRIQEGCGVVAVFTHAGGGHAVRIYAAVEPDDGSQKLRYCHDNPQSNGDPSDTLGLTNVLIDFLDEDGDGNPNFGAASRELILVWAIGPR